MNRGTNANAAHFALSATAHPISKKKNGAQAMKARNKYMGRHTNEMSAANTIGPTTIHARNRLGFVGRVRTRPAQQTINSIANKLPASHGPKSITNDGMMNSASG